ncbi:39S ribosomal protein S30, mitochondrial [Spea bombifrons]|uniref:39S ribosomal protein S30, mitochondrial n=1 Tax=Spea bombifrons TaxID=233779 RepID=UPI00234ACC0B|nr:39S ribosomal protein S30, mitochondrial [Spea bombifrons]
MAAHRLYGKLRKPAVISDHLLHLTEPKVSPAGTSLYPPVKASLTADSKASRRRRIEEHYNRVHALTDIREKLKLINGLQRLKYIVYPQTFALNADRWYQHFTKTAYVPGLPQRGDSSAPEPGVGGKAVLGEEDKSQLKSLVCEALLQEYFYAKKGRTYLYRLQEVSAAPFLTNLATILNSYCAKYNPVLTRASLDLKPEVNFYWLRGETVVPRGHRKGCVDPIRFQIDDKPLVQIRTPTPLREFVPLEHVVAEEVPVITFEPSRLPLFKRQYDNKVFIGSLTEDPCKFGHTQIHLVPDKFKRERFERKNLAEQIEVFLRSNGIASLFAWTGAQAMYQGFWSQSDVTRPFVSQAIISDGKYFSFFCYQLNTLALSVDSDVNNSRKNICWGTQSEPLYETVEGDNIKGFNDDIFTKLVDFFLNCPE